MEGDQGENGVRAGPETSKLLSRGQLVSLLLAHSWACCVAPTLHSAPSVEGLLPAASDVTNVSR